MKTFRVLIVASAFLCAFSLCFAAEAGGVSEVEASNSEYSKNGMPCIKEICLGDGLDELRKIEWDRANKASVTTIKWHMANLEKNYRGKLIASAPYLLADGYQSVLHFDNQALLKLDEVIASCGGSSLEGKFTTQGGNPTVVEIALIPTLDNREQKWTVVSIERRFPGSNSGKQFEEIRAQLDARYGAFSYKKQMGRRQKDGEAQYVGDGYGFTLKTLWPDLTERLRLHPACGGTAKVNID